MEPMTVLVLAFQLLAIFSIAGALLIYLMCKIRDDNTSNPIETQVSRVVVITSADSALGLQLCTHLAGKGCRVLAGMKDARESLPAKLIRSWVKMREYLDDPLPGSIIPIQLDVTREDVLREATSAMGAYLNANESGIAAVINTSGSIYRGRIEEQEVQQWENMLKMNILGSLRVAKAFVGFLRPTRGRLIYLGSGSKNDDGLVAFNASRMAVDQCAEELRHELQPSGVSVIALDTTGLSAEDLYKPPVPQTVYESDGSTHSQYTADVLSTQSLQVIERALWDYSPHQRYQLCVPESKYSFMLPCKSSMRLKLKTPESNANARTVDRV